MFKNLLIILPVAHFILYVSCFSFNETKKEPEKINTASPHPQTEQVNTIIPEKIESIILLDDDSSDPYINESHLYKDDNITKNITDSNQLSKPNYTQSIPTEEHNKISSIQINGINHDQTNNNENKDNFKLKNNPDQYDQSTINIFKSVNKNSQKITEDSGQDQIPDINTLNQIEEIKTDYIAEQDSSGDNTLNENDPALINLSNIDNYKIFELSPVNITTDENQQFFISLKSSGWIIKSINPELIKLLKRENRDQNTLFQFQSGQAGNILIIFMRTENNRLWRQPYHVLVTPKTQIVITEANTENKNNDIQIFSNNQTDRDLYQSQPLKNNNSNNATNNNAKKPEIDDYKKNIADQYFNQKKYNQAQDIYTAIINENKADGEVYYKMGIIEKENGNDNQAVEYFQQAINDKNNPYQFENMLELIKSLKKQNKFVDAIDIFFKYGVKSNLDSRSAEELNLLLADLYYNMQDYQNAALEYRRFIQLYRNSKFLDKATFYLAYSIENYAINPDYKEAYRLYKQLIELYPESRYYELSKNRMINLERHYLKIN